MSRKRDYISEIISKKSRLKPATTRFSQAGPRLLRLHAGLKYIEEQIEANKLFKKELMKYIPIACVACIEGYFRLVYRDLIDYGSPFCDNISGLKDIKFNMEQVVAIQGRRVSLGEFVSHLLPSNNLEEINKNMSLIIGEDFLQRLKNIRVPEDEGSTTSIVDRGEEAWLFEGLDELFELRHIFCHEIALTQDIDYSTADNCIAVSMALQIVTEHLVEELTKTAHGAT